jgi:gliotoxin/aspirochlorine biosynthesis gamma-glutamylcyclotransferase
VSEDAANSGLEWYFAYGSNLAPDTFCRRRRMQPQNAVCACLENFSLVFDLPVGPSNRGVANVVMQQGEEVWGVAYQISRAEGKRLDRSEGVHRGYYRRIGISVQVRGENPLQGFTYTSGRGRPNRLPSARYLGLLVTGARHHSLPEAWLARLQAWPLATDERSSRQGDLF